MNLFDMHVNFSLGTEVKKCAPVNANYPDSQILIVMGFFKHDYIVNLAEQEDSSLQASSNFAVPVFKWAIITPHNTIDYDVVAM